MSSEGGLVSDNGEPEFFLVVPPDGEAFIITCKLSVASWVRKGREVYSMGTLRRVIGVGIDLVTNQPKFG